MDLATSMGYVSGNLRLPQNDNNVLGMLPSGTARGPKPTVWENRLSSAGAPASSVAGGVVGYLIGALLYDSLGLLVIQLYGYGEKIEAFREIRIPFTSVVLRGSRREPPSVLVPNEGSGGGLDPA